MLVKRTRRAGAGRRPVLGPLVQHREPDRRRGGARDASVAHHHRHFRHDRGGRPGAPSARAAGASSFGDRPDAHHPRHRARAGDGQGARQGRPAARGAATRRGVPRQSDRRDDGELHLRDHRQPAQDRRLRRPDAADRPGRSLPHRRRRHLARAEGDLRAGDCRRGRRPRRFRAAPWSTSGTRPTAASTERAAPFERGDNSVPRAGDFKAVGAILRPCRAPWGRLRPRGLDRQAACRVSSSFVKPRRALSRAILL